MVEESFKCDAIQVINLDRSPERWGRISKHLNESGYVYQRFRAVDGYNVLINNAQTWQVFTGLSLKNKKISMSLNNSYNVYCDGDSHGSVAFRYEYYDHLGAKSLTAGEYGCWCSHFAIWQEAKKYQCSSVIVIEDDVVVKQNITLKTQSFVERVPAYDLFMFDPTFLFGDKHYIDEHKDVVEIKQGGDFWGTSGYSISAAAINKLTKFPVVTGAIDNFLAAVSSHRLVLPYNFSVYMASDGLVNLNNDPSEICVMGRGFEWTEKGGQRCDT